MAQLMLAAGIAALLQVASLSSDRVGRWDVHIAEASDRFGLPEDWIRRVILAESGGQLLRGGHPIVSRKGAMGLMQIMPATWEELRRAHGLGQDPFDPRDNIIAGSAYLRAMYDRFGYPAMFAAYNAGPARYARHLEHGQPLPAETLEYVQRISVDMMPGRRAQAKKADERQLFASGLKGPNAEIVARSIASQKGSEQIFVTISGSWSE